MKTKDRKQVNGKSNKMSSGSGIDLKTILPIAIIALLVIILYYLRVFKVLMYIGVSALVFALVYYLVSVYLLKQIPTRVWGDIVNAAKNTANLFGSGLITLYNFIKRLCGGLSEDEYDDELEEYDININNDDPFGEQFDDSEYDEDAGEEEEDELSEDLYDFDQPMESVVKTINNPTPFPKGKTYDLDHAEKVEITHSTDRLDTNHVLDFVSKDDRLIETHYNTDIEEDLLTTVAVGENTELDVYGSNIIIEGNKESGIRIYTDTKPSSIDVEPTMLKVQSGKQLITVSLYGIERVQFRNVKVKGIGTTFSRTKPLSRPVEEDKSHKEQQHTSDFQPIGKEVFENNQSDVNQQISEEEDLSWEGNNITGNLETYDKGLNGEEHKLGTNLPNEVYDFNNDINFEELGLKDESFSETDIDKLIRELTEE